MKQCKYFKIEHNHAFSTNNNWKTYSFVNNASSIPNSFEYEKNLSKAYEIRLRHAFNDKIASLIIDEFKKIDNEWYKIKKKHLNPNNGYGDHFEIFSIAVLRGVSYIKTISDYLICGSRDGGVDAIYYDNQDAYVYQIKIGKLEYDNAEERMKNVINEYMVSKNILDKDASDLKKYLDDKFENNISGKNINYLTISTNSLKENNITPEDIYNKFIRSEVERNKIKFKNKVSIPTNGKHQSVTYNPDTNHKEIFVFANANKLVDTFKEYTETDENLDYLFVDNVRGRLKKNETLIQTIKTEPKMFCFYNNGISIIGNFNIQEDVPIITITNPIIINGQQTMISLISAKDNGIDISNVFVPLFLKEVESDEELKNIAKYNNSQTKINSLDLLSIDQNLRKIQAELIDDYLDDLKNGKECFYLDIVRNGNNKHKQKAKKLFSKECVILVSDFVKLYSAIKNKEDLGLWKNNLNGNVVKEYKNGFDSVDKEMAFAVCKTIKQSKSIIGRNNEYRVADLTIQFLLYYGYSEEQILKIINKINKDSDAKNENKANAYRKKSAISDVRTALSDLGIPNKFDVSCDLNTNDNQVVN